MSLDSDAHHVINATWIAEERRRWLAHQCDDFMYPSGMEGIAAASSYSLPYTPQEKQWLKEHFGGEFRFLQQYGLHIYCEEDRDEGRMIAKGFMEED